MLFEIFNKDDVFFRAGVGACIYGKDGFLVFARARKQKAHDAKPATHAWQFPQGGRHKNEPSEETLWRELLEETGLTRADFDSIEKHPHLLSYEYDQDDRKLPWCGQTFVWYYLRLRDEAVVDFTKATDKEFDACKWMNKDEILDQLIGFKKELYVQLFSYFETLQK